MEPIEILALLFAVLMVVKILVSIFSPQTRLKSAEFFLKKPAALLIALLILLAIVGWVVFSELSVVQVAAAVLFASLLMGITFLPYSAVFLSAIKEALASRDDFIRKNWLPLLLWMALAIWVLWELFG